MPNQGMFTKGPILHFVVIPQANQTNAYFLGTHVSSPRERQEAHEIPVFNDLGGRSVRIQSINDGEEWKVFTTLNRFDMNIVRALRYLKSGITFSGGQFPVNPASFPLTGLNPPLGTQNGLARGTLVIGAQDFKLILVNSYAGTLAAGLPIAAALDMASARGYASCSITGYEEEQEENRVTEIAMAIECRNVFIPSTTIIAAQSFQTYFEGSPINFPPGITLGPLS